MNFQQLSPTFSFEGHQAHFSSQPNFTINNETRQFSSTSQQVSNHFRPVSDHQGYTAWFNGSFPTSYMQGPVTLRTEQSLRHSFTWAMSPHEDRSYEAMDTHHT